MYKYLFKTKNQFTILIVLTVIFSFLNVSYSQILKLVTLFATNKINISFFSVIIITILYLAVSLFFSYYTAFFKSRYQFRISEQIKNDIFKKTNHISSHELNDANLLSKILNQVDILRTDYFMNIMFVLMLITDLFFALFFAIRINPWMTLIIILLSIPGILLPIVTKNKLKNLRQPVLNKLDFFTKTTANFLDGLDDIKRFMAFGPFYKHFQKNNNDLTIAQINENKVTRFIGAVTRTFSNLIYLGTWVFGSFFVSKKIITLPDLIAFSQLSIYITYPLNEASDTMSELIGSLRVSEEVSTFLNLKELKDSKTKLKNNLVFFENVDLKLDNKVILDDANLELDLSKKNILVGASGAGKTTITKLISHQIKQNSGEIIVFGNDSNIITDHFINHHIGQLTQKQYFFDGTLEENINFYSKEISSEKITDVMQKLGLGKLLSDKQGLQQEIDAKNIKFSGGEQVRIGLARLLVRDYKYLFIDEVSSGLDPKTTSEIEKILLNLNIGYIYITHKINLNFLNQNDQVFILTDKKIVQGSSKNRNIKLKLQELGFNLKK
ncbi:MAG: ABC transporter ATP-binding protein/permease [Lactobacillaceae bacterium]|jgi:ABC-type multidrug transport system fused ATPase/permease subunit|nr:ABC transporter ATP-binding protein/permease [Lactobacillaceae bacterium]